MVMCVLMITQMPTRSPVFIYWGPDQPVLDLPVAANAPKSHPPRGLTEISLNRRGEWMALGQPFEEVEDLGAFLAEWAEEVRERGRVPALRLRIPGDAPAGYMRDAVMTAEELGYGRLLVAVYREE